MLQVRNLPDEVHARLKERAAAARMSLSDYVAKELTELVQYRSNAEIFAASRSRARAGGYAAGVQEILIAQEEARAEDQQRLIDDN